MPSGYSCQCSKPEKGKYWFILDYKCNYSAFNGYHYTPSDYSAMACAKCGSLWRTKANYVKNYKLISREAFQEEQKRLRPHEFK